MRYNKLMDKKGTIGVLDLGTPKQKSKLFTIEELVAGSSESIVLEVTDPSQWKIWPKRNQANSNTCVYQARAKAAGILREQTTGEFVEYSAADYNKRSNQDSAGSYPVEAFDLWKSQGIGLEVLEPSQNMSDADVSRVTQSPFEMDVAKLSKAANYVALPWFDFDTIVATLHATKKPIPLGFFGTVKEWNRNVPKILEPDLTLEEAAVHHEVCATPNYGIYLGEEGFTIEDSWGSTGIEGKGVRWITRSFCEKRNYIAGLYPTAFKTYTDIGVLPTKPKIYLPVDLEFGMRHPDVRKLQEVYKYEGLFPANHPGSELFHNITLECTKKFQVRYGVASPGDTGYGRVGPKTRAKINSLFN
jgi:hypothetical protein